MSFGQTYTYKKQPKILANGDYTITLGKPFEKMVSNFNVLRFPFTVDGINEEVIPNYFDLFDCNDPSDDFKVEMFQKQASRIKACFNLSGHFDESNYITWNGKKGKVHIESGENGFTNVTKFYKADLTPQEELNL